MLSPNTPNWSIAAGRYTSQATNRGFIWRFSLRCLANLPQKELVIKTKKGQTFESLKLSIHTKTEFIEVLLDKKQGEWLFKTIENLNAQTNKITLSDLKKDYENTFEDFELFWFSKNINKLKSVLLTV